MREDVDRVINSNSLGHKNCIFHHHILKERKKTYNAFRRSSGALGGGIKQWQ